MVDGRGVEGQQDVEVKGAVTSDGLRAAVCPLSQGAATDNRRSEIQHSLKLEISQDAIKTVS